MTARRVQHVHLLGIGGTGMTALAGLLHESGARVSGSDRELYPPTSTILQRLGLLVHVGFDPDHLVPPPDLVVVGNAISRGNPELEEVLDRRLPYVSMPRLIEERFLPGRHSVVVSGTHGKTTTTSMMARALERAGRDPGFLIGGAPVDFEFPFRLGTGEPFVLEGDEYDSAFFDKGPKFMHYRPDTVLLGSVEFDHADIYRDFAQVETAFRRLLRLIPRRGLLVYHRDSPAVAELAAGAPCRTVGYGLEAAAWQGVDYEEREAGARFRVLHEGRSFVELQLRVAGRHNVLNALAVVAACRELGLTAPQIRDGLESFHGVRRRLESKGLVAGVHVLDDFAHHPTAIAHTLESVRRRHPRGRLWAVLEPRSWSLRRNVFQQRLADVFDAADRVLLAPVYAAEAIAESERLDTERLAAELERRGRPAEALAGADAVLARLVDSVEAGDVVVLMSNGGFSGLPERLVAALRARERDPA